MSDEGREAFGAPTRVAYRADARGWLYVADSSSDRIVAADHPEDRAEPRAAAAAAAPRRPTEAR